MSLEELEDWIDHLDRPPLQDSVSMLEGYLTAIIVGPYSVNPYEISAWKERRKPLGSYCRGAIQCHQRRVGHGTWTAMVNA
jgi:hypothetical protein